jgi:ABC-2 type transport system ATP-binding protein
MLSTLDATDGALVMPTIDLAGVRRRFGGTVALDGVSLQAARGVTGLLGPNGAGKTTLLRVLATVLAPDAGDVRLLGLDPRRDDERVALRRRLGYLPQEPGFHRRFTAFEFVDYVAILKELTDRRARHDEVRRVLAAVDLQDVANRRIRALSGGMRRRVGLAQALLGDPDLLVLDEPTAGLDPEQRLRFRELVSAVAEHRTVVVSTHQTEDVAALCSRVVVLHGGQVRFAGAPGELADLARGRVWLGDARPAGATVAWRMGDGRYRVVGVEPAGGEPVEPSLEDGYMLLVGAGERLGVAA